MISIPGSLIPDWQSYWSLRVIVPGVPIDQGIQHCEGNLVLYNISVTRVRTLAYIGWVWGGWGLSWQVSTFSTSHEGVLVETIAGVQLQFENLVVVLSRLLYRTGRPLGPNSPTKQCKGRHLKTMKNLYNTPYRSVLNQLKQLTC